MYRIGVDVGGTFTDLVAIDEGGLTTLAKVPSTPEDPSLGVLEGLSQLAGRFGVDRTALLRDTERIVHGTTVATNALLEHKGARLGLLTTEGHRDVVERSEEHTSELQSHVNLVCRLLLEKKKKQTKIKHHHKKNKNKKKTT